jgi:hypothetical protein
LVNKAQSVEEGCKRSKEELIDMSKDVQYNKGCSQKTAQTDSQDADPASRAHEIMLLEAMEAARRSASKLRKLQRRAYCLKSSLEVVNFTGML